jgi:hypothetical protein
MIQGSDTRFAGIPFYKRDLIARGPAGTIQQLVPAPYAQVIFIGTEERVKPAYNLAYPLGAPNTATGDDTQGNSGTSGLVVKPITGVAISRLSATGTATITLPVAIPNVAENAFVIISDDGQPYPPPPLPPNTLPPVTYNGRIYRLGTLVAGSTTTFYLAPGEGPGANDPPLPLPAPQPNSRPVAVFIVGRAKDPATNAFAGGAQDVSVYTTFVQTP